MVARTAITVFVQQTLRLTSYSEWTYDGYMRQKGFTLIEIMIVVAIIGILTGMVTINLSSARERARDVERKGDLRDIANAMELYKNDHNPPVYPDTATWRSDLLSGGYLKSTPVDPKEKNAAGSWVDYSYTNEGDLEYTLVACLENSGDGDKDATNTCSSGVSYTKVQP